VTIPRSTRFDAIVIGAGFSHLYALHRVRELGIRTRVLEIAETSAGHGFSTAIPVRDVTSKASSTPFRSAPVLSA
jgi:cation diffusion facilitator CzcD-associated flavoprotein CzcO